MNATKVLAGLCGLAAVIGIGAWYRSTQATDAIVGERDALRSQVATLESQLHREQERVAMAETETTSLLKAIEDDRASRAAPAATPSPAITEDMVNARYNKARELARSGNWEAALPELLWLFDEGMVRFSRFSGVRGSFLLSEIAKMISSYPPAGAALRERRDRALERLLAGEGGRQPAADFAALNRALGDNQATLAAFDKLPAGDSRRQILGSQVFDQLLEGRRYGDAAAAMPYSQMVSRFDLMAAQRPPPEGMRPEAAQMATTAMHNLIIGNAAKHIEVLAGSGDLTAARTLMTKLLGYDGSDDTKAIVRQHLTRAGRADLLEK